MLPIKITKRCIGQTPEQYQSAGEGSVLRKGTKAEYLGHITYGNIRIKLKDGRELIVHPSATDCQ